MDQRKSCQDKATRGHEQSIQKEDGTRQCVILADGDSMRHTVTRVPQETRRASRSAQKQNSTNRLVHGGHVEQRIGGSSLDTH